MNYLLIGLFAAALFGIAVTALFGAENLLALPWLDSVVASLFLAGILLQVVDNRFGLGRLVCRGLGRVYRIIGGHHLPPVRLPGFCLCNGEPCG